MTAEYTKTIDEYTNYNYNWEFLRNKKIMISGATGLVGRFFIDVIMLMNNKKDLNCTVIGLCRNVEKAGEIFLDYVGNKNFAIAEQDVSEPIKYDEYADYVIHAASNTHPIQYATDPIGTIKTNVYGTNNLLEYCKKVNAKKFLLISSFEVYGSVDNVSKISETDYGVVDILKTRSCYPESKRLSESLTIAYSEQDNIDVSIVRLSRVFGPTMALSSSLATAQFIKNVLNNEDIVLKSLGNQQYSYNFVGDAVTAILTILEKGGNREAYNVSDENYDLTLGEFAKKIASAGNKKVVFDLPDKIEEKGFSNSVMTITDSSKLKGLGWKPLRDIDTDIGDTLSILRSQIANKANTCKI